MQRCLGGIESWLLGSLLSLSLILSAGHAQAAEPTSVPARIFTACGLAAGTTPTGKALVRYRDLDLFVLAEAREALGQAEKAAQVRQYLKTFFPKSTLLSVLPTVPDPTPVISEVDTDPEWSRLVQVGLHLARTEAPTADWSEWFELVLAAAAAPQEPISPEHLHAFVQRHPEGLLAGWAAYQGLWEQRLLTPDDDSTVGFQTFWAEHRAHPLANEASEAQDVRWFSPRAVAHLSTVFPGWGEEILEPGLRESSRALLSETIYLLGTLGFLSASQHQARAGNLTGALIFLNLLMLNHQTSGEQTYVTATRRNDSERRRFIAERVDRPIIGTGTFAPPEVQLPETGPMARDLIVAVGYGLQNAAAGWRGQGLIRDEQLDTLVLNVDWTQTFWDTTWGEVLRTGVGVSPHLQVLSTQAEGLESAPINADLAVNEWGGALQVVGLIRWEWGGPWMQLKLGAGPGYRHRAMNQAGFSDVDQGQAWFGSAALALGGESGMFWQVGWTADDSFQSGTLRLSDRTLERPSRSQQVHFGLGAYF